MASKYKDKDAGVVLSFNGKWISWAHTIVAYGMCETGCISMRQLYEAIYEHL
jgi:hypothetical protein